MLGHGGATFPPPLPPACAIAAWSGSPWLEAAALLLPTRNQWLQPLLSSHSE